MAKVDPYTIVGKSNKFKTFEFVDDNIGLKFTMNLRRLGGTQVLKLNDVVEEFNQKYIVDKTPLQPVMRDDGSVEAVEISYNAIQIASVIAVAQVDDDPYTFEDIVHFMALSSVITAQFASAALEHLAPEMTGNFSILPQS